MAEGSRANFQYVPKFRRLIVRRSLFSISALVLLLTGNLAAQDLPTALWDELRGLRAVSRETTVIGETIELWGVGVDDIVIDRGGVEVVAVQNTPWTGQSSDARFLRLLRFDEVGVYTVQLKPSRKMLTKGLPETLTINVLEPVRGPTVIIPPGFHRWNQPLKLQPGTTVVAHGATIDADGGHLFHPAPFCTIDGGTFRNFDTLAPHGDGRNMTLRSVTLQGGTLGHTWLRNNLRMEECLLSGFNLHLAKIDHAAIIRCTFQGIYGPHPVSIWGGSNLALIDNVFDATDRGIIYQGHWGPSRNNLHYRNRYQHIHRIPNGNELILFEQSDTAFFLDLHSRVVDSGNDAVSFYGGQAHRHLFYDLQVNGPNDIKLWDLNETSDESYTHNIFWKCELRGGTVKLDAPATDNHFFASAFIGPFSARTNDRDLTRESYSPTAVFDISGRFNRFSDCVVSHRGSTPVLKGNAHVTGLQDLMPD